MLHFDVVLCGLPFRLALVPHSLRTYSISLSQAYQERGDHYSASFWAYLAELLSVPVRLPVCLRRKLWINKVTTVRNMDTPIRRKAAASSLS